MQKNILQYFLKRYSLNIVPYICATSYANGELTLIHVCNTAATEKYKDEACNH